MGRTSRKGRRARNIKNKKRLLRRSKFFLNTDSLRDNPVHLMSQDRATPSSRDMSSSAHLEPKVKTDSFSPGNHGKRKINLRTSFKRTKENISSSLTQSPQISIVDLTQNSTQNSVNLTPKKKLKGINRTVQNIRKRARRSIHQSKISTVKETTKSIETRNVILRLLGDKTNESHELPNTFECDANLLQDLDLVILAAPTEDYKLYTKLLRQEYSSMNDVNYKQMRLKVLETLLIIPNIFSTPEYQTKFEQSARDNIKKEINELKA